MAIVKTIKRYGEQPPKKRKNSKARKNPTAPKNTSPKKLTYTYVLKDLNTGLYKIGKSTSPLARFNNLCSRGQIFPISLLSIDIEEQLHTEFADSRVCHPDLKHTYNGGTEWFTKSKGGKFKEFIEKLDCGQVLPYITAHRLAVELLEENKMLVGDSNAQWEIANSKFGYYILGVEILVMLGYISRQGSSITNIDTKNILMIKQKIAISEDVVAKIKNDYIFYIGLDRSTGIIKEHLDKSRGARLRKVVIETSKFDSEVFLLLNTVLC